jgi:hypothetical protein
MVEGLGLLFLGGGITYAALGFAAPFYRQAPAQLLTSAVILLLVGGALLL